LLVNVSTGGNSVDVYLNFTPPATPYPIYCKGWWKYHPQWPFHSSGATTNDDNNKWWNFNFGGGDYAVDEWYLQFNDASVTSVNVTDAQISTSGVAEGTFDSPDANNHNGGNSTYWNHEPTSFNGTTTATVWQNREVEIVADSRSWTAGGVGYVNAWANRVQSVFYVGRTDKGSVNPTQRGINWGGYARDRGVTAFRAFADLVFDIGYTGDVAVPRLMLGDQPTFASCTNLEYQPPISWADDLIVANCWKGALSAGLVYPYVITGAGTVIARPAMTMN
jgi:hypothetical protein